MIEFKGENPSDKLELNYTPAKSYDLQSFGLKSNGLKSNGLKS
jgi:hypothetical protein